MTNLSFVSESAACTCQRRGDIHTPLKDLLSVTTGKGAKLCHWQIGRLEPSREESLQDAACQIADAAMRWRCRGAVGNYRLWRDAVNGGSRLYGADLRKVLPFVTTAFGTAATPKPEAHLCGWVAEFVWYQLAQEINIRSGRRLRRLEGPSFHATEPGGDGLTVWELETDATLTFCLWEIKNHVGESALSATVGRAYQQLEERATEYLAKLTEIAAAASAEDGVDIGRLS